MLTFFGRAQLPPAAPSTRQASPRNSTAPPAPAQAAAAPAATGIPGPGQPPLDYPSLLALIKANPVLVNQLPAEYQKHFGTLLKIPIPYPADYEPAVAQSPPTPVVEQKAVVVQPTPAAVPAVEPSPAVVEQQSEPTPAVEAKAVIVDPTPAEPTPRARLNGHGTEPEQIAMAVEEPKPIPMVADEPIVIEEKSVVKTTPRL